MLWVRPELSQLPIAHRRRPKKSSVTGRANNLGRHIAGDLDKKEARARTNPGDASTFSRSGWAEVKKEKRENERALMEISDHDIRIMLDPSRSSSPEKRRMLCASELSQLHDCASSSAQKSSVTEELITSDESPVTSNRKKRETSTATLDIFRSGWAEVKKEKRRDERALMEISDHDY
nr:hypothetical protein Iba_chr08dCG8050 [Ipomoea batatas]